MSKTSKQTSTSAIDPQMRAESEALTSLGRSIAGMGYNPFTGNTQADFTPAQRAAFQGIDAASSAFGMPGGASTGGPTGATEGAYGIMGFSPESAMRAEQGDGSIDQLTQMVNRVFAQAATETPKQKQLSGGGGKK